MVTNIILLVVSILCIIVSLFNMWNACGLRRANRIIDYYAARISRYDKLLNRLINFENKHVIDKFYSDEKKIVDEWKV